ncbi:hypothetical protein B0G69_6414 [Paraburkholderia sp. RAU2J]|uniref:hypothetical protein n=1 Tax=Paraburkholderia sp. RAU2J TaxID=1938810 RepID=UPI000EAC0C78|nr:hypothetical protein [Paraburkholderia sp. RAU2J]RKT13285.1 hypothetical protein B0G69_6414 [Paraburkholderia sp. RAU2J]
MDVNYTQTQSTVPSPAVVASAAAAAVVPPAAAVPDVPVVPVAPKPADELQAKQARLRETQDQIAALNKTAHALQADVTQMEAKAKEVADTAAAYDATLQPLKKRLDAVKTTLVQKLTAALAVIKDDQARIDGVVADFDKSLAAKAKDAVDATAASVKAAADTKAAQSALQAAQVAYTEVKGWANQLTASVTAAENLVARTIIAETQGDYIALYVLVREAQALLPKDPPPSTADHGDAVQKAQDAVVAAQQTVDKATANAAQAAENAASTQKAADAAKASRMIDLLAAVAKAPAAEGKS